MSVLHTCKHSLIVLDSLEIKNTLQVPTEGKIYSASIHPDVANEHCVVAGGEDFKLYKYSTEDGSIIGSLNYILYSKKQLFTLRSLKKLDHCNHMLCCITQ